MNVFEQLEQVRGCMNYAKECLKDKSLQNWERKEYEDLVSDYEYQIQQLEQYIQDNKKNLQSIINK